jgi:hypothetical protein
MKSMHRRMLVVAVAVLALGITSASASAAEWHVGGKALTGSSALATTTKVEESITLSLLEGAAQISCTSATLEEGPRKGSLAIIAPSSLEIGGSLILGGCKMTAPSTCSSQKTIITEPLLGAMSTGTAPEDKFALKGKSGKSMVTLTITGTMCVLAGEDSITGSFTLIAPSGQTELAEQTFVGQGSKEKPAGASLFGQPAYLSGKFKLKLASGGLWSFH